jgi:hypothetical protein
MLLVSSCSSVSGQQLGLQLQQGTVFVNDTLVNSTAELEQTDARVPPDTRPVIQYETVRRTFAALRQAHVENGGLPAIAV